MDFSRAGFVKARRSSGQGDNCVECTFDFVADGVVGVRDSKDPTGPVLAVPTADWRTFLAGVPLSPRR
ncbi:DUF397 domain-containing protein [Longispora sp. K20-0274]|uniref:DUF397 domain-containing protein n=1 Tax=Longispora sp. K20-0274 TaxID=3088255 RepID=UPI00399BEB38